MTFSSELAGLSRPSQAPQNYAVACSGLSLSGAVVSAVPQPCNTGMLRCLQCCASLDLGIASNSDLVTRVRKKQTRSIHQQTAVPSKLSRDRPYAVLPTTLPPYLSLPLYHLRA